MQLQYAVLNYASFVFWALRILLKLPLSCSSFHSTWERRTSVAIDPARACNSRARECSSRCPFSDEGFFREYGLDFRARFTKTCRRSGYCKRSRRPRKKVGKALTLSSRVSRDENRNPTKVPEHVRAIPAGAEHARNVWRPVRLREQVIQAPRYGWKRGLV